MPAHYRGFSVDCMVDYQPLLSRALAKLRVADAFTARHSVYERARIAQRAQLQTPYPPLRESEIAREQEALERAIALVESRFRGERASLPETSFATGTPAAVAQHVSAARTEALIAPVCIPAQMDPQSAGPQKSGMWLTAALAGLFAAVLGAVLAVTGTAIAMRHTPPDLAHTPEASQEPPPEQPTKIAERAQQTLTESNSTVPAASVPLPPRQSGVEPAIQTQDAGSSELPDTARAAMLIASDDPRRPMESLGKTVWSIIPPVPGHPATVAVKADADIPELKMHASMILRKNTDPTLQATYTIDLKFSFADGAPISGVKDVEPKMRNLGLAASEGLTNVKVKLSDKYFLIALAKNNVDLMRTRAWFEFSLLLNDDRVAKLVLQKSTNGEETLTKAFEVWK